jgi:hypothetical protein
MSLANRGLRPPPSRRKNSAPNLAVASRLPWNVPGGPALPSRVVTCPRAPACAAPPLPFHHAGGVALSTGTPIARPTFGSAILPVPPARAAAGQSAPENPPGRCPHATPCRLRKHTANAEMAARVTPPVTAVSSAAAGSPSHRLPAAVAQPH